MNHSSSPETEGKSQGADESGESEGAMMAEGLKGLGARGAEASESEGAAVLRGLKGRGAETSPESEGLRAAFKAQHSALRQQVTLF